MYAGTGTQQGAPIQTHVQISVALIFLFALTAVPAMTAPTGKAAPVFSTCRGLALAPMKKTIAGTKVVKMESTNLAMTGKAATTA